MNILLIRLRLIGDVVFTTPLLAALRRHDPAGRLAYLVEPHAAPVVMGNPRLDEVIVATRPDAPGRWRADLALARRLRADRYDLVIDLHGGPRSALLSWASGAPRRIGYTILGRSWMYTQRVGRSRVHQPRHSVANQWDLLTPLGIDPPDPERDRTEMPLSESAVDAVRLQLAAAGLDASRQPIIVLHVSAGNRFRRWPAASFVTLLCRLVQADSRRRVVVISGPSEREAAGAIGRMARAELGALGSAIVDEIEFDLAHLRALMTMAAVFIGGDSGPLHLAGTSNVPIVGLYGPTLAARSAPWRPARYRTESLELEDLGCRPCDQRACAPGDFRCLAGITPDMVVEAAERCVREPVRTFGGGRDSIGV